ncbi:MAG: hypothetical protein HFF18_11940 [Oscillospiraceae bacterium]|nr:hypothetical protein [Oscillospiraceae bacterium]
MKRIFIASWAVLLLTVLVMAVNRFLVPLPDWAVRVDGVLMLAALSALAFAAVRLAQSKR